MADLTVPPACVLIPAYNEISSIGRVVHQVRDRGLAAIVVDDGSKDGTASRAREAGAEVLSSPVNRGKGASLRLGIQRFLERHEAVLVMMDADGQHDPAELDFFLKAIEDGADFVVGNRMHRPERMPRVRIWTNRLMSRIISFVAGHEIPDSQCGYRAMRREVLEKVSLKTARFEIETEMILEASRAGFKIVSIPIRSVYQDAESQIRPVGDTFRFVKFLFGFILTRPSFFSYTKPDN